MNRIRRLRRSLACLPRRAGALAAFAAAPAARRPGPPSPPGWKLPSGWNDYLQLPPRWRKHPPLPLGHVAGPVYKVPAQIPAPHHHHGRHARLADHLDHGHGCAAGRRSGANRLPDAEPAGGPAPRGDHSAPEATGPCRTWRRSHARHPAL